MVLIFDPLEQEPVGNRLVWLFTLDNLLRAVCFEIDPLPFLP